MEWEGGVGWVSGVLVVLPKACLFFLLHLFWDSYANPGLTWFSKYGSKKFLPGF